MRQMRGVVIALSVLVLLGCASERVVRLGGGSAAPAAQGTVKVAKGPNANTRLKISVKHLAPPDRVSPGATVFVVWARPIRQGGFAQNLGALKVNQNLEGTLETVTPLRDFDLLITPEPTSEVARPSDVPVLITQITQRK